MIKLIDKYKDVSLFIPSTIRPTSCKTRTQSYLRKTSHGAIRTEVTYLIKELEMPIIKVDSIAHCAKLTGRLVGSTAYHNGYSTNVILVTDSEDETAKILIGTYVIVRSDEIRSDSGENSESPSN